MSQIPKKSLQFLKQLAANNNKLWFDAHRNDYDAAKADFINFIADIIKGVSAFDNTITGLEAKKTVFRIDKFVPNVPAADAMFIFDKSKYPGVEVVDLR